ncbi:ABC transporter permease [Clostridiaceae bacterium HSG29]|nr:ABC transporter permease [Clostridiaceae bacterium HSG29]
MTNRDLMVMGLSNLKRRKMRTFLTVLGVVIGAASIIVMLSLGIGMNRNFMKNMESMGSLNVIDVSPEYQRYEEQSSTTSDKKLLDDEAIEKFKNLEDVDAVMPILDKYVTIKAGRLESSIRLLGIDLEVMEEFDFKVGEGTLPTQLANNEIVFGAHISEQFYDPKSRNGFGNNKVDLMKESLKLFPEMRGNSDQRQRGINIKASGILEPDQGEKDWSAYMDINSLEKIYEDIERKSEDRSRRKEKEDKYQSVKIKVNDIDKVADVSKKINDMGYRAWSLNDMLDGMKKTYAGIQAILGGIGGVSLFVAAIGITNTMVMSIYERTKEIGIMKVIGAELKDIKKLFLFEAAMIGCLGGIVGMVISFLISQIINKVAASFMGGGMGMGIEEISYIPVWLYLSALGFSTFVGVLAGYYPAVKAMKLSVLEAIRTE